MMSLEQFIAQRWNSLPETTTISENPNGCFDCNICLDFAQEPVVTLCGHLYCWPCIYKWLQIASNSNENSQCPVCKADISSTTVIPLYGRGQNLVEADPGSKDCCKSTAIPPRPPALGTQALISSAPHRAQQQLYGNPNQTQHQNSNLFHEGDSSLQFLNLGNGSVSQFQNPVMGMFGEMMYARVFGDPVNLLAHPHMLQNVGTSPRARRQELEVDKSLSRISIFLFCCFLLCLIVF